MNHCIFVGNIVKKPEARTVVGKKGDITVIKFKIGVNDRHRNKVTFPNLEAWGDQADLIFKHLGQGDLIRVYTRLETDSWTDAKSGEQVYRDKFVVERFEFVESRRPKDERRSDEEPEGGSQEAPDAGEPEVEREPQSQPATHGKKSGKGKGREEDMVGAGVKPQALIAF